jgi:hypothetical protein
MVVLLGVEPIFHQTLLKLLMRRFRTLRMLELKLRNQSHLLVSRILLKVR